MESGDAAVGNGYLRSVFNALGLMNGLADLADPGRDRVGLELTSPAARRRAMAKSKDKRIRT